VSGRPQEHHASSFEQVEEAAAAVRSRCGALPETAIAFRVLTASVIPVP